MSNKQHIFFIVNPISGVTAKKRVVNAIDKYLDRSKFDADILYTERPAHATELTKEVAAKGATAVIAVGGDGSVNEVGRALIHQTTAMGIIPVGSGNGFARHLKIPLGLKGAIERINRFETKIIDTASINGEGFLGVAGIGFDAQVGWEFANFKKRGFLSYIRISTQEYFKFKPETYRIQFDGQEIRGESFIICLANSGQYGNNAWIAPEAAIDDGKLSLCILKPFPKSMLPDIIWRLFNKKLHLSPYYESHQVAEVEIMCDGNRVHLDGEPMQMEGSLKAKIHPASLRIIV